jgi:hypothetical protein
MAPRSRTQKRTRRRTNRSRTHKKTRKRTNRGNRKQRTRRYKRGGADIFRRFGSSSKGLSTPLLSESQMALGDAWKKGEGPDVVKRMQSKELIGPPPRPWNPPPVTGKEAKDSDIARGVVTSPVGPAGLNREGMKALQDSAKQFGDSFSQGAKIKFKSLQSNINKRRNEEDLRSLREHFVGQKWGLKNKQWGEEKGRQAEATRRQIQDLKDNAFQKELKERLVARNAAQPTTSTKLGRTATAHPRAPRRASRNPRGTARRNRMRR